MKEHRQADTPNLHINRNGPTPEYIETGHKLREKFLHGIQLCDQRFDNGVRKGCASRDLEMAKLNILNRVPNNKVTIL